MPESDDPAADVVAVDHRQVAVEDDDVVVVDADPLQRRGAVVHDVDGHGLPAQPGGHRIGEQLLVLDDEYAHGRLSFRWTARVQGMCGRALWCVASILPLSAINRL